MCMKLIVLQVSLNLKLFVLAYYRLIHNTMIQKKKNCCYEKINSIVRQIFDFSLYPSTRWENVDYHVP